MKEITKTTYQELKEHPIPGRYFLKDENGNYTALKIDFKGNLSEFKSSFYRLAMGWLKK